MLAFTRRRWAGTKAEGSITGAGGMGAMSPPVGIEPSTPQAGSTPQTGAGFTSQPQAGLAAQPLVQPLLQPFEQPRWQPRLQPQLFEQLLQPLLHELHELQLLQLWQPKMSCRMLRRQQPLEQLLHAGFASQPQAGFTSQPQAGFAAQPLVQPVEQLLQLFLQPQLWHANRWSSRPLRQQPLLQLLQLLQAGFASQPQAGLAAQVGATSWPQAGFTSQPAGFTSQPQAGLAAQLVWQQLSQPQPPYPSIRSSNSKLKP